VEHDIASVFYRDGYTPDQAASVMARVPEDLEIKTAAYCRGAARGLGFDVVDKGGEALCYIEFGTGAKVDSLPGVAGGSRFLGTFDRAEAVTREEVDFFASGHPLVEGLLLELEDGLRGRAALMEIPRGEVEEVEGAGLLCIYKRGPDWSAAVVSADGTLRPTWASPLLAALPGAKAVDPQQWGIGDGWAEGIRALAACAEDEVEGSEIVAAAFFRTV
jgi:ATP-dependent helicase HepA